MSDLLLSHVLSKCERQENGCLDWKEGAIRNGYGRTQIEGEHWLVHRLVWTLTFGPIPNGLCVLHSCDRPQCCEITHLWLGPNRDNSADMVAKDRQAKGSAIGQSKLTAFKVWQVRKIISLGYFSDQEIADIFDVTAPAIRAIRNRRTWAWLHDNPFVPIADLIRPPPSPPSNFIRRICGRSDEIGCQKPS